MWTPVFADVHGQSNTGCWTRRYYGSAVVPFPPSDNHSEEGPQKPSKKCILKAFYSHVGRTDCKPWNATRIDFTTLRLGAKLFPNVDLSSTHS